jgi:hypothetical protein
MLELFRLLLLFFIVMHALTHLIYFVASWTSMPTGFGRGRWVLPGNVTIHSLLGRLWGLAALVVIGLFGLGVLGLLIGEPAWVGPANLGVFLSFAVVVPWLRQSPRSIGVWQVFADLALMFVFALPVAFDVVAG